MSDKTDITFKVLHCLFESVNIQYVNTFVKEMRFYNRIENV